MTRSKTTPKGQCYFGLESKIVRDSLDSLSSIPKKPLVVGGLAIQLYAKDMPSYLRNTPDLDLIQRDQVASPTFEQFLEDFYNYASHALRWEGYKTVPKKGRGNNALVLTKGFPSPNFQKFLLHMTKFSPRLHEIFFKDYIEKQFENSQEIIYDKNRKSVNAASLEEVLPLKLWRSTRFGTNRRDLVGPIYSLLIEDAKKQNWGQLANSLPLLDFKTQIDFMQAKINEKGLSDKELVSTYKLTKDIYDILLSAKVISDSMTNFDQDRYTDNVNKIFHR